VGQPLENGIPHPHMILNAYFRYYRDLFSMSEATFRSLVNVQIILINSIQSVYKSQGINISDKHVEIIVKQMGSKIQIQTASCFSKLLPGEIIDFQQIKYINTSLQLEQKPLISYHPIVLGITRTSLLAESFISAASFQETTRVLARAAIEGKIEWLRGLKENVVTGKLIPAGTGLVVFNTLDNLKLR
jgi:DNA-directed RNA polymerase subunit beta'